MKNIAYLTAVLLLCGARGLLASDCDCNGAGCGHQGPSDWICLPQPTTKALEVTEWGVQCEVVCPPRGRLCLLDWLSQLGNDNCCDDAGCDAATCDSGGCESGCDCDGGAGVSGGCDVGCAPGAFHLPGIGPRLRKKLMRKTLVYNVPAIDFVAQPVCEPCGCCPAGEAGVERLSIDFTRGSTAAENMASTVQPGSVQWLNVAEAPLTTLLTSATSEPSPATEPVLAESPRTAARIHWIEPTDVEPAPSLGTIPEAAGFQPPAPISAMPAARAADALPKMLLPYSIQR